MNILIAPFVNAIFGFYYWSGNLGVAIILATILIKLIVLPLVFPSMKSAAKMRELQPKLNKLKEKYGKDQKAYQLAQMDLYKQEKINPLAGCLPSLLQVFVLIVFFQAFNMVVNYQMSKQSLADCKNNVVDGKCVLSDCKIKVEKKIDENNKTITVKKCVYDTVEGYSSKADNDLVSINSNLVPSFQVKSEDRMQIIFFGSDLLKTPSKIYKESGIGIAIILPIILLVGSALLQYFSAKIMMPAAKTDQMVVTKTTPDKEDDMMAAMRTQSLYMMPAMTLFLGWTFSLGMLLYWFISSVVAIGQQVLINRINKK